MVAVVGCVVRDGCGQFLSLADEVAGMLGAAG